MILKKSETYGALFDAHVHSYFDFHDGMIPPKSLVKKTKKIGLNWVTAMSHDTTLGISQIKREAKKYNIPVLPAIEISTGYNHILAYGIQEWPYAKDSWNPEVVIEKLREQDCAIYLSHPAFRPLEWYWEPEIASQLDIDGIEWINGSNYFLNHKVWDWYQNWSKGKIAGSDAHHITHLGYSYTQIPIETEDLDDLVSYLKKGICYPQGRMVPLHRFLLWEFYRQLFKKFVGKHFVEGRWVMFNDHPRGVLPEIPFNANQWRKQLLSKYNNI